MGTFCTLNIYLKNSLKFFVYLWFQYSKNALNYKKKKCRNTYLNVFCDVSKIVANSKILITSGAPIRVIFQNSVTYIIKAKFFTFKLLFRVKYLAYKMFP